MRNKVKVITYVSLLIAMEILFSRFLSIALPTMKIGFGFAPIAICGMMFGPLWAGAAGALADIIGATLFPIGAYFPGFTVSAALTGIVFGLFLKSGKARWWQLALAVGINCICISLLLSTYWLTIITGTSFFTLLPTRILQNAVMIPVQFIVLRALQKPIAIYGKKQFQLNTD